jgi:hypothetical protein
MKEGAGAGGSDVSMSGSLVRTAFIPHRMSVDSVDPVSPPHAVQPESFLYSWNRLSWSADTRRFSCSSRLYSAAMASIAGPFAQSARPILPGRRRLWRREVLELLFRLKVDGY